MTLEPRKVIDRLNHLIQLDRDAVKAYEAAIKRIDVIAIAEQLETFRRDHERHIVDLSAEVRRLGGTPADSRDVKGPLIQGFTAVMSMIGVEEALRAMRGNEELTNKKYNEALMDPLPEQCRQIVQANLDDERRHLAYLEQCLRDRLWEATGVTPTV